MFVIGYRDECYRIKCAANKTVLDHKTKTHVYLERRHGGSGLRGRSSTGCGSVHETDKLVREINIHRGWRNAKL